MRSTPTLRPSRRTREKVVVAGCLAGERPGQRALQEPMNASPAAQPPGSGSIGWRHPYERSRDG